MPRITGAEQLDVFEEVGRGGFGVVRRAVVRATSQEVAVKQIDLEHELADFSEVGREIQILLECRSPQITQYLGCFVHGHTLWVVMEYVDGGSLHELLVPGPIADERTILAVAAEVLAALAYLHAQGKIHRDLKTQNVLVAQSGAVKLADFGVSTQLHLHFSRRNTTVGTPYWMAPEVIVNHTGGHSYQADIWSLGCCVYELRHGMPPLQDHYSPMQALRKISACKRDADFAALVGLPLQTTWLAALRDFLACCFSVDPQHRPSAAQLLQHEFVRAAHADPDASRRRVQSIITRKRRWDQENGVVRTQRAAQRPRGSPTGSPEPVCFDISTIKSLAPASGPQGERVRFVSPSKGEGCGGPRLEGSRNKTLKTDFRKVLARACAKLELRTPLSAEHHARVAALNEALLELFTPVQAAEAAGPQSKILACHYLKHVLKEVSKPTLANKQLQKAIVPSVYLLPAGAADVPKRPPVSTAMDEIERSLLGSWLDKLDKLET